MEAAIVTVAAKLLSNTFGAIGRYILPRVCPLKNLWKYKSNLENLKTELKNLEDKKESVDGLTRGEVEPLADVKDWLKEATDIINEVRKLISEDNPECCEGCACSNLKECAGCCKRCTLSDFKKLNQQSNDVARMLKDVARHLQKAMGSSSVWEYKSNLENLKKQVKKLEAKRDSVKQKIKAGEEPLRDVKLWQDKVNSIIGKALELIDKYNLEHQDISEQQNEVHGMLKHVDELLQEEFQGFSHPSIPEQTYLQPSIQQEFSESRKSILKDIIAALTKADVNIVGIYGMGGVGKTTVAKKVGSQAKQDKLFERVVFVEVSQSPDIRTIQGVIADHLGLQFKGETVPGRASELCDYLKKKEEKILIILDNLWKGIKLEEVGIPFGNVCEGLKLLLTARSRNVLTEGMDSQHICHVQALSEKDAWILFKNIAGTHVDNPPLKFVATEIANKCGGMPLAIVTVAKALKDMGAEEWKDALRKLNNPSPENFEGVTEEVYNSIKLSYDYLGEERIKRIFLLCSRMGHTYDASVQDLFRYGFGLGYFGKLDTMEDALCNVYASVNKLKANSLLLDAPETKAFSSHDIPAWDRFAIHDVICDVARSIASKDQHVCTVINGHVPRFLKNENTLKNCTSITLDNIGELPKDLKLVCPKLEFLYVKPKNSCLTIPNDFFEEMSSLQVLHLIGICLKPLPSSLSSLENLQALCLDRCKLGDVVAVGDMKKLEILSFHGSDIEMLPEKMCQLTNLRLLDLRDCSDLSVIPLKVMSGLTGIEALYMHGTSNKWKDARPILANIDELKHLRCLTILEMCIPNPKMFRGLISSELKRYKISIGIYPPTSFWGYWKSQTKISRMLRLCLDTKEDWIISQLPGVEELDLSGEAVGAINLLDDLDRNGFPQLMYLHVSCNNHCVCIVTSVSRAVLPSLESLTVQDMGSLKKICKNSLGVESFLNLKTIHVGGCNNLSNIFCFFSIVRVLPNLIDLQVFACKNMEEIFAIEERDDGNSTEVVHDINFSQLSSLRLTELPKLKSFCCKAKTASPLPLASDTSASQIFSTKELNNHSSLFNEKVVTPNLQDMKVYEIHQIEQIWHSLLPTLSFSIQNLTNLSVYSCDNLNELFSSSIAISKESREKERRDTIVFPKLNSLKMGGLTKLTRLCSGYNVEFPLLKVFKIQSCPQLKAFIFDEKVKVPSLEHMTISDMDNLKMIWHNNILTEDSFSKLKSLEVAKSKKLLTVIPSNMCGMLLSLESLNVDDCYSLEQIWDLQGINSEEDDHVLFMNLQELNLSGCPSLKYIIAKEGVVAKEVPAKFVFPKLTSLKLNDLPKLRTFYSAKCTVEGPVLKKLELNHCGIHCTDEEGQMQQPLYLHAFPCLEELKLAAKEFMMIWQALEVFDINQNLKKLTLIVAANKWVISCGKDQTQAAALAKMKTFVLQVLQDLKYMCEQDSKLDLIFQNFEVLIANKCKGLVNLMHTFASFQNITILNVFDCDSLETIVTSSMAKSLMKLEKMSISFCPKITEVVQNQGDVNEERIIFSNLKTLVLRMGANLTSFCSCNFTLEFPSLEELEVWNCRNMETFSWGDLITPRLRKVTIDVEIFRLCADTDLNTIIQQFHETTNQYSRKRKVNQGCSSSQHME